MGTKRKGSAPTKAQTFLEVAKVLRKHYGRPTPLPSTDPFELILWENVAYLASPARRREAFELLKRSIGTAPAAILNAGQRALGRVTVHGILKGTSATKLRECALIAVDRGDLGAVIEGPLKSAKRVLRSFPGIGEPGAERILLFTGKQALLAPESNGLRVLTRLGLVGQEKSYSRTYAASREVAKTLPAKPSVIQEIHLLLQHHGRTLCKHTAPACEKCPLVAGCSYAADSSGATNRRPKRAGG